MKQSRATPDKCGGTAFSDATIALRKNSFKQMVQAIRQLGQTTRF